MDSTRPLAQALRLTQAFQMAALALLLPLMCASTVFLFEWWTVSIVADPATIAGYRFGSEAMVAHGGTHYASAATYASSALRDGIFTAVVAIGLLVGYLRKSVLTVFGSVLVLLSGVMVHLAG